MSLTLDSPLTEVPGLPPRILKALGKEGVEKVRQIVEWLPFRHEDRRQNGVQHTFQPSLTPACHQVRVTKTGNKFFGSRKGGVFEAQVEHLEENVLGQSLTLRWWGMPFMSRSIAEGQELVVYGRIKDFKGRLSMDHPEYEVLGGEDEAGIHTGRITPVYRLRAGITQKALRTAAWYVFQSLGTNFTSDVLPTPGGQGEFSGWSHSRAVRAAHFAQGPEELETARRYLALEEFYIYQLRVVRRRRTLVHSGGLENAAGELTLRFVEGLPFSMTGAQKRSLEEIQRDMASHLPMNRLLHGDVGSGKTVVAFAAMLGAVQAGRRAALMAPTQILAEQHFLTAQKWLEPLGLSVALRTAARSEAVEGFFSDQQADIVIGTHALLYDDELLKNAGLVVIDEQHKFGVAQRARLIQQGGTPDVLVMTATPIPRTLTLTIYGDLDVSTLDERPKARGKIITRVRPTSKQDEAAKFLLEQLEQGRQAYLVYPIIEESEKLDVTAVTKGCAEWAQRLPHFQTALLHGRMSAEEKEQVMRSFRAGKVDVLVSTTVIEVGVDVPNASVMYIHHAERYGLAQLHQLRGRVGRGEHTSYCVLFVKDKDDEARERLAILEETTDGFRISEEDLKRRGPGDVLGRAQSGQAPLQFAEMLADTRLVRLARRLAEKTLDEDPHLNAPRLAGVRSFVLLEETSRATLQ